MASEIFQPLDLQSFLQWEEQQDLKHEFDGVTATSMVGVTVARSIIQVNLAIVVGGRLRGGPCHFFGSDLKLLVSGSIRYPDGFVVCTQLPADAKIVTDPVVIS